MKTILKISIIFFILTLISSCGNKIDKNIDKLKKMENEYIKACSENNFDNARSIVEQMGTISEVTSAEIKGEIERLAAKGLETGDYSQYRETKAKYNNIITPINKHWNYVNDKEIYYLLAKPSRESDSRILYLYNSYEKDQLPDMEDVLEVAISMNDENLTEKLIKSGIRISPLTAKAAVISGQTEIVDLILSKEPDYLFDPNFGNAYKEEFGIDNYIEKLQKNLFFKIEVPSCPPLGIAHHSYSYEKYESEARKLNKRCLEIIRVAISAGKYNIAEKTLQLMRPNLDIKDLGSIEKKIGDNTYTWISNYKVTANKSSINEAKKIIQESK